MIGVEYIGPRQSIATGRYHFFRGYIRAYRLREVDNGRIYTRARYVFDHGPSRKRSREVVLRVAVLERRVLPGRHLPLQRLNPTPEPGRISLRLLLSMQLSRRRPCRLQ
jgi:hypothetical protein